MKKIVAVVLAVAVIFGAGLAVKKTYNRAGEPPIGSTPVKSSSTVVGLINPNGEPPIGS